MKVAMLDPSLFTGRYDDSLCAALGQAGQTVTLFGRPLRVTDAIAPNGYVYAPHFFRLSERLGGARALKAVEYALDAAVRPVDALAADVVHSQWLPLAPADRRLLARLHRRAPLVHTVHNANAYHDDDGVQGRGYGSLLGRFDALIVHGEETRAALLKRGIAGGRIHVVAHPPMRLAEGKSPDLTAAEGRVRILFFGTIRPYKGLELLIDSCIDLWRRGLMFELAVAGKPFMDVGFLDTVRQAGFGDRLVTELGFLKEERLDGHLKAADIIVFPYSQIDSSGALLSALHYGAALVTSDAGMFARLGDAVARFPAGDGAALTAALLSLIENADMRRDFGRRAQELEASLGTWEEAAMRTIAVYAEARARWQAAR